MSLSTDSNVFTGKQYANKSAIMIVKTTVICPACDGWGCATCHDTGGRVERYEVPAVTDTPAFWAGETLFRWLPQFGAWWNQGNGRLYEDRFIRYWFGGYVAR